MLTMVARNAITASSLWWIWKSEEEEEKKKLNKEDCVSVWWVCKIVNAEQCPEKIPRSFRTGSHRRVRIVAVGRRPRAPPGGGPRLPRGASSPVCAHAYGPPCTSGFPVLQVGHLLFDYVACKFVICPPSSDNGGIGLLTLITDVIMSYWLCLGINSCTCVNWYS